MKADASSPVPAGSSPLGDVAALFLKLGTTAFGGPAAHVAMMEDEVVRRRGWLTRERFLDFVGATNFIPGPNSTELAIHVGHARAGWAGLVTAGACFILPAALLTTLLAAAYTAYGALPETGAILRGIKPVVIAIVAQALLRLGRTAIHSRQSATIAVLATIGALAGMHELLVLALAALAMGVLHASRRGVHGAGLVLPLLGGPASLAAAAPGIPTLPALFVTLLKIGSVLFGSGYVLLAFLRADFVDRLGWITEQQLLDAVAIGQVTPGPVFTAATFIGYLLGGWTGAAVATLGIFLPAFVFVAISGPVIPRLRRSPLASAILDGVNAASLALMAVVTLQLSRAALVDWLTVMLALVAGVLLVRFRVNAAWLVVGGGVVGSLV